MPRQVPGGSVASDAEVMLGCRHLLVGPQDGALSEELGEVGLGRWGEGRGSPVNKLGSEPRNHLLLIKLFRPLFSRGKRPQGVHWPFLNASYHQPVALGVLFTLPLRLSRGISVRIKKQILFIAPDAARWFPSFGSVSL